MSSQAGSPERLAVERRRNLRRALKAGSIVFFGGKAVEGGTNYLRALGFRGEIWMVNPTGQAVAGVRCFRYLDDLPAVPDVSVIATRPATAIQIVEGLAKAGVAGAVCYSAGFAEVGPEGRELQRKLVEAAGPMALVGPNCTGFANLFDGVAATVVNHGFARPTQGVAIVAQSGTIAHNAAMSARSLPIGYAVSVGNQACIDSADFIDAFLDDPRVNAIGVYIEEIADPRSFSVAALRALEAGIPIVAFKGGISQAGRKAALSHTASLSGANEAYDAFFETYGILRATTFEHFLESLKSLTVCGIPRGDKLAVMTCSGMEAMLSADLAEAQGISMPPPSAEQTRALQALLPKLAAVANPLDYTMAIWGKEEPQRDIFLEIMRETYDAGALVANYPSPDYGDPADWEAATNAFIAAKRATGMPGYFISSLPEGAPPAVRQRLLEAGIAPLQGLDDGMAAIGLSIRYSRYLDRMAGGPLPRPMEFGAAPPRNSRVLGEWTSKQRFASVGIAIPRGIVVSPDAAAEAAESIGFPVAIKAVGEDVVHKSDLNLVELNLRTREEVASAVGRLGQRRPSAGTKLLVEEMVTDAVAEIIVGLRRDPLFGIVLLLGSGGVLAELARDTATLLLPATDKDVRRALAGLRCYPLMRGFRGRPLADVDALVDTVLAIASIPGQFGEVLMELDVNPVLVRPVGFGVIAADAMMLVGDR